MNIETLFYLLGFISTGMGFVFGFLCGLIFATIVNLRRR